MISSKLKYLREKSGYTQQRIADFLSIDRSTYAYYESGKTKPDIKTIMKLSEIFNVPCTEFLENEHTVKLSDSSPILKVRSSNVFRKKVQIQEEKQSEDLLENEQKLITYFRMFPKQIQEEIIISLSNMYKRMIDIK